MQTIRLETRIAAPSMRVFRLSLHVDLHIASAQQTQERIVDGVTHGEMKAGDTVTWQAKHFGLTLNHESRITVYRPPNFFQDTMVRGNFRHFIHDHSFQEMDGITLMVDELHFQSPAGLLGVVVDRVFLRRYLQSFLLKRNAFLKSVAEGSEWTTFLGPEIQ